jgi:hypothetical protein
MYVSWLIYLYKFHIHSVIINGWKWVYRKRKEERWYICKPKLLVAFTLYISKFIFILILEAERRSTCVYVFIITYIYISLFFFFSLPWVCVREIALPPKLLVLCVMLKKKNRGKKRTKKKEKEKNLIVKEFIHFFFLSLSLVLYHFSSHYTSLSLSC